MRVASLGATFFLQVEEIVDSPHYFSGCESMARFHVDQRSLRDVALHAARNVQLVRVRTLLDIAKQCMDVPAVYAIMHADHATSYPGWYGFPEFASWFRHHAIKWFDLYRDDEREVHFIASEDEVLLRKIVREYFPSSSEFWDALYDDVQTDTELPQVRRDLLMKLANGEEPVTSVVPSARTHVDARFRAYCAAHDMVILKKLQEGDDGTDLRSHVYLVLDQDGIAKVYKEALVREGPWYRYYDSEPALYRKLSQSEFLSRCYGTADIGDDLTFMRLSVVYGQELSAFCNEKERMSADEAAYVLHRVAATLEHLHSFGIMHLDIRPENIKMNGPDVVLLDLSAGRYFGGEVYSSVHVTVEDPKFAPPEVTFGCTASAKSDIWQLGMLYCCLRTGTHPFAEPTIQGTFGCTRERELMQYTLPQALAEPAVEKWCPGLGERDLAFVSDMMAREPLVRPTAHQVRMHFAPDRAHTVQIRHARRQPRLKPTKNTVLFPARMGVPHKGHIDFIARIMELGFHVKISLQRSFTITDRDPYPKWIVMKMIARSLLAKGFRQGDFSFMFTPYFGTDEEHRTHFAAMPGRIDVVAVASSNPSVHDLFPDEPFIEQYALFGHEREVYEVRSWGEELREAIKKGDRKTFSRLIASGAETVMSFEDMRTAYARNPVEFVPGAITVELMCEGTEEPIVRGRAFRYCSPEESIVRYLAKEGKDARMLDPYALQTRISVDGSEVTLGFADAVFDGEKDLLIRFSSEEI